MYVSVPNFMPIGKQLPGYDFSIFLDGDRLPFSVFKIQKFSCRYGSGGKCDFDDRSHHCVDMAISQNVGRPPLWIFKTVKFQVQMRFVVPNFVPIGQIV